MSSPIGQPNRRILVIDDSRAIHDDFRKILVADAVTAAGLQEAEVALFGDEAPTVGASAAFEVDSAYQGQEGLECVKNALALGRPYALAFVDIRMPPGWDGIETIAHLMPVDPELQIVICTAYSDYSWEQVTQRLGTSDRLLILKKPFDNVEVLQLALALTEKWNLGRQVRQRTETLEELVTERTKRLEEQNGHLEDALARLQEAHAQLLQTDKLASIGQLAAGVAHEINNPIGFITSNLNSLGNYVTDLKKVIAAYDELLALCLQGGADVRQKADDVERLRAATDVHYVIGDLDNVIQESIEGARRVRQIVADLRDFSHIDNPDVSEEDLNTLLDKTINVAWNELKYKADVVREYGEIPAIPCYGGQLGQVFLNLLVNAVHAIAEHGTITVRTGREGDRVWIEVRDTGCGIPPENLKRVFDPFFTTKPVGQGTGMGLHLCYKIVQAHGGRISVESIVGQGSTFRVVLPVTGPPAAKEPRSSERHECPV